MEVKLLNHTPLWICSDAIRTCWSSHDKSDTKIIDGLPYQINDDGLISDVIMNDENITKYSKTGEKDKALIDKVGNKNKHSSTLEHLYYNFHIYGISRALLQELARHRIASLSVKSTRYTLKELKNEKSFIDTDTIIGNIYIEDYDFERAKKYLVFTGISLVDEMSIKALENLRKVLVQGISNDKAKYCLPESYKTELAWSINARSLQNFLFLRSSKAALWEIRELANNIYNELPEEHKYLFKECINEN